LLGFDACLIRSLLVRAARFVLKANQRIGEEADPFFDEALFAQPDLSTGNQIFEFLLGGEIAEFLVRLGDASHLLGRKSCGQPVRVWGVPPGGPPIRK
jgi:hypothetical protein